MRTPNFKIKKFVKSGYTFYGIHVPAYINSSGKSGYYYYHTRADAERGRTELIACLTSQKQLQLLSNSQQTDALRALEFLMQQGVSASLTEAVQLALPRLVCIGNNVTVQTLCEDFAAAKASSWSKVSARNFRNFSRLLIEAFGSKPVSALTTKELQGWLAERFPTPGYLLSAVRNLRPAFNYAVRQDIIKESPFTKLESVRARKNDGIDIFTPAEARRLMEMCPDECVPAFALLLFAGVRPAELTRLKWGNIKDGFIHITPSIAKTAQVRNIEIEPNLVSWLTYSGIHADSAPICPENWRRRRELVVKEAGLAGRKDTARHSYATYHLAKYQNTDALKSNMGHSRGSDTLFVHYRAAATPAQAEAYWNIQPHCKKTAILLHDTLHHVKDYSNSLHEDGVSATER